MSETYELAEECFTYGVPLEHIRQGGDGVFYVVVAGRGVVPLTNKNRAQLALQRLFNGGLNESK